MKRLLSRIVVIAAVAGLIVLLWVMYRSEVRDRRRLEANQRSLLTDVEYYRTRDSLSAAGVERLTLTNREFRRHAEELERTVEALHGIGIAYERISHGEKQPGIALFSDGADAPGEFAGTGNFIFKGNRRLAHIGGIEGETGRCIGFPGHGKQRLHRIPPFGLGR